MFPSPFDLESEANEKSSPLPSDAHTLVTTLAALKKDIARPSHARRYEAARGRYRSLVVYESAAALLASLAPSSPLTIVDRSGLVSALVTENRLAPHPFWTSLLLVAFEPMLIRLRMRASRRRSADLDQRVLVAFLAAVRSVSPGTYVILSLRRATARGLFEGARDDLRESAHVPFEEETHPADVFGTDETNGAAVAEIVRIIEAKGGEQLRDAMLATRAGDESLRDYVARMHPDATHAVRASIYERLLRAREAVESELRVRLAPRAAPSAA